MNEERLGSAMTFWNCPVGIATPAAPKRRELSPLTCDMVRLTEVAEVSQRCPYRVGSRQLRASAAGGGRNSLGLRKGAHDAITGAESTLGQNPRVALLATSVGQLRAMATAEVSQPSRQV